jgi:type IV pilus assembly protein PilC
MGLSLDHIKKTTANASPKEKKPSSLKAFLHKDLGRSKVKDAQKESIYAELALLLQAGLNLKAGLDLLVEQQKKGKVKEMLTQITNDLTNGDRFSEAIRKHKAFTDYEYYSLEIGEETGNLEEVLQKLARYYGQRIEQRRALIGALTYPFIVMCTAVLAVGFMLTFMVPLFSDVFARVGGELPALTQMVIKLSENFSSYLLMLLVVAGGVYLLHRYLMGYASYKSVYYKALLVIPVIGPFLLNTHMLRFTESMSLLISSKVPLLEALDLSNRMIRFYPISKALSGIHTHILQGKSLETGMREYSVFSIKMTSLVKVGEEASQLHMIFKQLSEQLESELKHRAKVLGNVVEPLIIVFLGLMVALILVAMYLPMFELSASFG